MNIACGKLLKWLHNPFGKPPATPMVQLRLSGFGQPKTVIRKKGTWLKYMFTFDNPSKFSFEITDMTWTAVRKVNLGGDNG